MAYINRENLIQVLAHENSNTEIGRQYYGAIYQKVMNFPTADVVEVVRCRNCKHAYFRYNTKDTLQEIYACEKRPTGRTHKKVSGDFFCKHGKRKEGD